MCPDNPCLNHLNICPYHILISTNANKHSNVLIDEKNLMDILEIIKVREEPILIILDLKDLNKFIDVLAHSKNIIIIYSINPSYS